MPADIDESLPVLANDPPVTVLLTSGYGGFSVMVQSVGRQKPR